MKYLLWIAFTLTVCCAFSQSIELTPRGVNEFCTDSAGVREIAKLKKRAQLAQAQLRWRDSLYKMAEQELSLYAAQLALAEQHLGESHQRNRALQAQRDAAQRRAWYMAIGGFALGALFILLL